MTNLRQIIIKKVFPQGKDNIIALRFKGYEKKWKEKRIEETLKLYMGKDYKKYNSGNIPVYGSGGYITSINKELSNNDAIGIGRKGTIDNPFFINAPFWAIDTLFYAIPYKGYDIYFLLGTFMNIDWKGLNEASGVPSLSRELIYEQKIFVPELEEQKKIGNLLRNIETLSILYEKKLEKFSKCKCDLGLRLID